MPLSICIVSDFFLPRLGGVELHQYCLAQALINLGHKVIVVTGSYGDNNQRQGIRYVTSGLKIYYCPQIALHNQVSAPTLFTFLPLFRSIVLRENIDIIHGHQTTSPLAHQCIMYGKILNIPTLFTDHSMFGIATPSSIHVNKLGQFTLTGIDQVIAVSHTLRENIVIRTGINPNLVSVVPNALDHTKFRPDSRCTCSTSLSSTSTDLSSCQSPTDSVGLPPLLPQLDPIGNPKCSQCKLQRCPHPIEQPTFVILSRLVYRKGIDFVVYAIPLLCKRFPQVRFVVGGDGPHSPRFRDMLQMEKLTDRVTLLGEIPHHRVRDVLQMGHIFINTSLTETFCIAILEAICTGLHIVATRVGGVPEVLPHKLIKYCDPNHYDVHRAMEEALLDLISTKPQNQVTPGTFPTIQPTNKQQSPSPPPPPLPPPPQSQCQPNNAQLAAETTFDPFLLHDITAPFYSWYNVAKRTIAVYHYILTQKYLQQEGFLIKEHASVTDNGCAENNSQPEDDELVPIEFNHQLRQKHKYNHLWYLIRLYWKEHGYCSSLLFIATILLCSFIETCCEFFLPSEQIEQAQNVRREILLEPSHQDSDGF